MSPLSPRCPPGGEAPPAFLPERSHFCIDPTLGQVEKPLGVYRPLGLSPDCLGMAFLTGHVDFLSEPPLAQRPLGRDLEPHL